MSSKKSILNCCQQVPDKVSGAKGRADVWYDRKFVWRYKGAPDQAVLDAYVWL